MRPNGPKVEAAGRVEARKTENGYYGKDQADSKRSDLSACNCIFARVLFQPAAPRVAHLGHKIHAIQFQPMLNKDSYKKPQYLPSNIIIIRIDN